MERASSPHLLFSFRFVLLAAVGAAGGTAAGCTGNGELDGDQRQVAFVFPTECSNRSGITPCTEATFDELAKQGQGSAFETSSAKDLPSSLISVLGSAAPADASGLDVILLIDGTGGMGDELEQSTALFEALLDKRGSNSRIGLAIYRDKCIDHDWLRFQDLTHDFAFIAEALTGTQADGGRDIPDIDIRGHL